MIKKIIFLLIITVAVLACNNTQKKSSNKEEIVKVEVATFNQKAEKIGEKKVEITAFVKHVCQHGGQRMFLADSESNESVKVIVGKGAAFNTDLEGQTIHLIGHIDELRIDETYLLEWENEIKEDELAQAEQDGGGHNTGSKAAVSDLGLHIGEKENIANFRKQLAESNKDYISFFSIVCENFRVIEPTAN